MDRGAWWAVSTGSHRVRHGWSNLAAAAVWIRQCYFLNSAHTPFPLLQCPYVHFLCLCLCCCSPNRLIYAIFCIPNVYVSIWYLFFWLTSLCMTDLRSIHVSTNDPVSFLFMAESYFIVYMYHIFFIYSSVDGHLGGFHVLLRIVLQWILGCMCLFELGFSQGICPGVDCWVTRKFYF